MVAQQKKKHSDFYYKLSQVNDKIDAFTKLFYNKMPQFEEAWRIKQEEEYDKRVKQQKIWEDERIQQAEEKKAR